MIWSLFTSVLKVFMSAILCIVSLFSCCQLRMFCLKSVAVEEPPKRACMTPTQKNDSVPTPAIHGATVKTNSSWEKSQEKRLCTEKQQGGK